MRGLAILILLVAVAGDAGAIDSASLGYTDEGTVIGAGPDDCGDPTIDIWNHDGSFENGYAWQYGGIAPPYYGAFGEGLATPWGNLMCAHLWVTTLPGYFQGQTCDIYVWEGGVTSEPGQVLYMLPGVVLTSVPIWPTVGENAIDMYCGVNGEVTLGYWGNWPGAPCGYFVGADMNGFGGHPWTYIAMAIGYPSGWQDPSIIWGPTQSLGIGVGWSDWPWSPVEGESWGSVKTLFR